MQVNNLHTQTKETQFEHDLAYGEYLRTVSTELSNEDINKMEKVFYKTTKKSPLNNPNYQPLQGA